MVSPDFQGVFEMRRQKITRPAQIKLKTNDNHKHYFALCCLLALVCLSLCGCRRCKEMQPENAEQRTLRQLSYLRDFIIDQIVFEEPLPFQLPDGDRKVLELWLANRRDKHIEEYDEDGKDMFEGALGRAEYLVKHQPSGELHLVDIWNNPLKYQGPAEDPKYVFRLYSVGPNGKDENGGGDDIDASRTYKGILSYFEDPKFDGNTYRKYKNQLTLIREKNGTLYYKIRHP